MENNLTHSSRKFVRLEKARIRAEFFDYKKQQELINELYKKVMGQPKKEEAKEEAGAAEVVAEKVEIKKETRTPKATTVKKSSKKTKTKK